MIKYDCIVDYKKIEWAYHKITTTTKHRRKLISFELCKFTNFVYIYSILKNKKYTHGRYNIFLISIPKHRVIMSENLLDKIVNHLVSEFVLFPAVEPYLLNINVATRPEMGLDKGIFYVKKYLNLVRNDIGDYYLLKCDINKYFYNIDHDILFKKLERIISDKDLLNLIHCIVNSTDESYVNKEILKQTNLEIERLKLRGNYQLIKELENIPLYQKGKGLPIGNMTSQVLAIFYLSDLDHFIKEKLHIKYYVRYMDDFLLFHNDLEYLKYCKEEIRKFLENQKLDLNRKTNIMKLSNGFTFLGYKFLVKNTRIYVLSSKNMKKKLNKRLKKEGQIILDKYNGYLKRCTNYKYYIRKKSVIK